MTDSVVDILEGQTQAGKTTTMISTKFLYMVDKTKEKRHLIVGNDLGTVVSNIVSTGTCGLCDTFPEIQQNLKGNSEQPFPHLKWRDNIIYLAGYSDVSKWKKILGKQLGAVFVDEINIANMDFIRELFLPRFEYLMATLNPDNPSKEIYNEIINRARPIDKYKDSVPGHIWEELNKSTPTKGWHYWFCTMDDNPSMTEDKKELLLTSLLPETREYQTKILGVRTVGTGLVMPLTKDSIINEDVAMYVDKLKGEKRKYKQFCCGIDTSYSNKTHDTFDMIFAGITNDGKYIILEERTLNNRGKAISLSPSDMAQDIDEWFTYCCNKWGNVDTLFIDSADAGTISEMRKFIREHGRSYNAFESWKKLSQIDRVNLVNGWIKQGNYLIVDTCKNIIAEHNVRCWDNKDQPEDANNHGHDASAYSWQPYKYMIGVK